MTFEVVKFALFDLSFIEVRAYTSRKPVFLTCFQTTCCYDHWWILWIGSIQTKRSWPPQGLTGYSMRSVLARLNGVKYATGALVHDCDNWSIIKAYEDKRITCGSKEQVNEL